MTLCRLCEDVMTHDEFCGYCVRRAAKEIAFKCVGCGSYSWAPRTDETLSKIYFKLQNMKMEDIRTAIAVTMVKCPKCL